ncbi:MAG: PSD1 domain-containing protein [Planctomycetes bacterium]|nr:PSD1 domain-containing protein [Planctomycetota bacterium]
MSWRTVRVRWKLYSSVCLSVCVALVAVTVIAANAKHHKRKHRGARQEALAATPEQCALFYTSKVRPLLVERCVRCHGPKRRAGGLRVDSVSAMLEGGDGGAAIFPGNPDESPLLLRVIAGEMPRGGEPFTEEEIALLRDWIKRRPVEPADELTPRPKSEHWAFQPTQRPAVPSVADPHFAANPIDAFLEYAREKAGVAGHNAPADRRLLLRRVSIDLTGLPPTEEEYREFLDDPSAAAYENCVDRLLAGSRYAERWARHWMDVWRYSSHDERKAMKQLTYGSRSIWRWRDYIIEALDMDKGLDRMIVEMLAGDEVAREDPKILAATGYLVRNFNTLDRNLWLSNTIEHTGRAFLGLTMGCARCHNHKFDPISQKEYYRFRAFFEPHEVVDQGDKQLTFVRDGANTPTHFLKMGDPKMPDKRIWIEPQVPAVLGHAAPPKALELSECGNKVQSSGRRLALARWLVRDDNPLAARVAVNHIWLRHFGRGLVETPAEFGVRGKAPTHPELLDWLAVEFRQQGWSMKWLHRLIVTSVTYQMSSSTITASEAAQKDPDNRLYGRFPARRMEAEVVRDSILHLAGKLSVAVGGPDVDTQEADTSPRRSLYLRLSRVDRAPLLDLFDCAKVEECYQRVESVVPQQGLALLNSSFVWRNAGHLADRLAGRADFIEAAFATVLGRPPTTEELDAAREFLRDQEELLRSEAADNSPAVARTYFIHALFNHNDFLAIR